MREAGAVFKWHKPWKVVNIKGVLLAPHCLNAAVSKMHRAGPTEKQHVLSLGRAGCCVQTDSVLQSCNSEKNFWASVSQRESLFHLSVIFKQDCLYLFPKIIIF